jgi:hypothetical protein
LWKTIAKQDSFPLEARIIQEKTKALFIGCFPHHTIINFPAIKECHVIQPETLFIYFIFRQHLFFPKEPKAHF